MKADQDTITYTFSMSTQNCKLRPNPVILSGKEIFSNHLNDQLPHRQISSGAAYLEKHLFAQIPKMQSSLYTIGTRIKGLTTKTAFDQYNLSS